MRPFSTLDTAVFDSNIWILGITQENEVADFLMHFVMKNRINVYVSAYIYDEVFEAFDRSLNGSEADKMKTKFANFVETNESVEGPTQQELRDMDLYEVRSRPEMQMIGRMLGIQPKDVPIVVLAWQYRDDSPTIVTADEPFSEFSPSEYNLPEVKVLSVSLNN